MGAVPEVDAGCLAEDWHDSIYSPVVIEAARLLQLEPEGGSSARSQCPVSLEDPLATSCRSVIAQSQG